MRLGDKTTDLHRHARPNLGTANISCSSGGALSSCCAEQATLDYHAGVDFLGFAGSGRGHGLLVRERGIVALVADMTWSFDHDLFADLGRGA